MGENWFTEALLKRAEKSRRQKSLAEMCQRATQRANYQGGFVLTDIGLLAYRAPQSPKIVRTTPVMTDMRWLRPFVEVRGSSHGKATIVLEIVDNRGRAHFRDEVTARLRGKTRILTETWLPLERIVLSGGRWSLVVTINGVRVAVHRFEWAAIGSEDILEDVREDGEIGDELRSAVAKGKFRKMSLDELLADQEE